MRFYRGFMTIIKFSYKELMKAMLPMISFASNNLSATASLCEKMICFHNFMIYESHTFILQGITYCNFIFI